MKLTLGFSPCPNDTFIFDAIVNGRIDTEGLEFDYFMADVEELNRKAFRSESDIIKISCHAYAYAAGDYLILDSGSALGFGNGPLLISKPGFNPAELKSARIAIPGKYTTANFLFSIAWPDALNKKEYLFSDINDILLRGEADAGLIIHETRFTYHKSGLVKVMDMGEYWENLTGLPIPLGIIAVNRKLPADIALSFNRILRKSIEYARSHPSESSGFIAENARELEKSVVESHINMFVNDFSVCLGPQGRGAISELFRLAVERRVVPQIPGKIFLT